MSNEKREQQMMAAADRYADEIYKDEPDNFHTDEQLCETINDFCAGWREADQHPQWIPVEERLPPRAEKSFTFSDYVLVCDNIGYMDTACYNFEKNRWDWLNNVTHWMPLPPAPRKEE